MRCITESQIKAFERLAERWESVDIGMGTFNGGKPLGLDEYIIVADDQAYPDTLSVWVGTLANQFKTNLFVHIDGHIEGNLSHSDDELNRDWLSEIREADHPIDKALEFLNQRRKD